MCEFVQGKGVRQVMFFYKVGVFSPSWVDARQVFVAFRLAKFRAPLQERLVLDMIEQRYVSACNRADAQCKERDREPTKHHLLRSARAAAEVTGFASREHERQNSDYIRYSSGHGVCVVIEVIF